MTVLNELSNDEVRSTLDKLIGFPVRISTKNPRTNDLRYWSGRLLGFQFNDLGKGDRKVVINLEGMHDTPLTSSLFPENHADHFSTLTVEEIRQSTAFASQL